MSEAREEVVRGLTDAARILGVSRWTLRDMLDEGLGIPSFRTPRGHYRFPRKRLIEWRDSQAGLSKSAERRERPE